MQCDDLLRRSRELMAQNDPAGAESLIVQAERLGVEYPPIYLGDTPKRARRDLDRMRGAAGGSTSLPSQLFSPLGATKKAPPSDPFMGQNRGNLVDPNAANVPPDMQGRYPMPTMGRPDLAASGAPPFGRQDPMAPPAQDDLRLPPALANRYAAVNPPAAAPTDPAGVPSDQARARNDYLLREARRALAMGDVRRAADMIGQARQLPIRYAPSDDTPDRVGAAIVKYQEVNGLDKGTETYRRAYARMLMEQSEALLNWKEYEAADQLAGQAARQQIDYGPYEARPDDLLRRIAALRQQNGPATPPPGSGSAVGPKQPSGVMLAGGTVPADQRASRAFYDTNHDQTRNIRVSDQQEGPEVIPTPQGRQTSGTEPAEPQKSPGYALFQQGEAALKAREHDRAYQLFRQASAYSSELDSLTAQRLQDHLQLLSVSKPSARPAQPGQPLSPADELAARQQALVREIYSDVANQASKARALREKDAEGSLALLQDARRKVEASGLDPAPREQILRRIDRDLAETQQFIEQNRPRIELAEKNDHVKSSMAREAMTKEQMQQKLAELVDEFNKLNAEHRFEEAYVIAKRASELAPNEPIVTQMLISQKMHMNLMRDLAIKDKKEQEVVKAYQAVDAASTPFSGDIEFPDAKVWGDLVKNRKKYAMDHQRHRSERELEIEKRLKTPVSFSFRGKPLSQVLEQLAKLADININLDEEGLRQEGLSPDTPVTLEISREIMLKSALNLILENRHLCYIVKDEVLRITSEQMKSGQIYRVSYPVGDLVMPIPNFVPNPNMGMSGALHQAMSNAGLGGPSPFGTSSTPLMVASRDGKQNNAAVNPTVMAQMMGGRQGPTAGVAPSSGGAGAGGGNGPGGLGGAANADFESLIELITQTVSPKSWEANGGQGNIAPFETNLSLVVSQTQEVHEQIVDLLEQLRRMQDLQVTIEVRFITLNDSFFERIGVNFDFNIMKNTTNVQAAGFSAPFTDPGSGLTTVARNPGSPGTAVVGLQTAPSSPSAAGMAGPALFTSDLDIPVQQGSYALAVPQFGGFDAAAGASLGFAILSDIEAYFFINAAQGDKRTNVLQAPKVTLFNGQQAFVSDTSQTPFVISVIPVVGDFAAAQQPVIVVLSEGTFMTVQAVVSNDRRFVRLTIVPFFSKIANSGNTFTFQGSDTTTNDTTKEGVVDQAKGLFQNNHQATTHTHSGVTVQLPTFSFVTVTTTVSVPDGGTVLLGGIKRLSEARNEYGVPILDKIPYLNRLFKNTSIGRDTSSLMMMVTPRIIIQEEEEEKLGIQAPP